MKFRGKYSGLASKYLLTILLIRKLPERAFIAASLQKNVFAIQ